ncbi:right-handed parallel beta-helix repeat-containing protein [Gimesia sp.]|uniref:beta strand repeat-containing protein n=1 Tax=Gimesia sp. TaxID=2024833 RepID=UPI0025BA3FED|nr:right-handed parallel beta-helix repeat-containing protein [Gimesia sp.]
MKRIYLALLISFCAPYSLLADTLDPIVEPSGIQQENINGDVSELFGDSAWFGRYRPHFGYRYEAGDTIGRIGGLSSFDGFIPLFEGEDSNWLTFFDARLLLDDQNNNLGSNIGFGARQYLPEQGRTIGGYIYYDTRDTGAANFDQVSGGIETLGDLWDARLNWYVPTGQTRDQIGTSHIGGGSYQFIGHYLYGGTLTRYYQAAMTGVDMEAGRKIYSGTRTDIRAFAGWYHFQATGSPQAWGWKSRVESRISDVVSLNLSVQNDRVFDTTVNFAVGIQWPSITGLRDGFKADIPARDRLGESPERLRSIVVANQEVQDPNGGLIINPATGNPYYFMHVATGGNSDGSYEDPYATLAAAFADPRTQAGDLIVYDHRNGAETGDFVLAQATQVLSEGPAQFINSQFGSIQLPDSGTGVRPQITGSFTLNNGSVLSGFDITTVTGSSIIANGVGDIRVANNSINNTTISSAFPAISLNNLNGTVAFEQTTLSKTNGTGLRIDGGNADITFTDSTITANNATYAVNIQDAGGSIKLGQVNGTNSTFDAYVVNNSADITIDELNSTDANSLPFTVQNNTGSFALNGGTISNSAASGGQIDSSQNVTVQNVTINSAGAHGLNITNSSNLNISNNTIVDADSDGIRALNSSGNVFINKNQINSIVTGFDNAILVSTNADANVQINENTITSVLTVLNDGINVTTNAGNATLNINGNKITSFANAFDDAIYVTNNSTGTMNTTISQNTITNTLGGFGDAIIYYGTANGVMTTNISNNNIHNTEGLFGDAIVVVYDAGSATTTISQNTIDSDDLVNLFGTSIYLGLNTTGTTTSHITQNIISDDNNAALFTDGIALNIDQGTNHSAFINNNQIAQTGGLFDDGIEILLDSLGGASASVQVQNNLLNGSAGVGGRGLDVATIFGSNSAFLDVSGNTTDTALDFSATIGSTITVEDLPNLSTNNNGATINTFGNVVDAP